MDIKQACNVLRVEEGTNDELIESLIKAIPSYIEAITGMSEEQQSKEPLVETASSFILTLWYYADHADDQRLQRTIDNLLKCITLKVDVKQ